MVALHYPLERHIFHLLFQEDSVDVPGFGRIESQRFGAEIQLQSGLFLPPARRLSFSPVAGPSQLLVNHISRFENLTPEESKNAIARTVRNWNQQLAEGNRLRLDGIGSFSKTGLQWVFQAALESNFLPEAYGLPIFRVTPLSSRQTPTLEVGYQVPLPQVASNRERWFAPIRTAAVVAGAISLLALGTTKSDFRDFVQKASFQPSWEELADNVKSWFQAETPAYVVEDTFGVQSDSKEMSIDDSPNEHSPLSERNSVVEKKADVKSQSLTSSLTYSLIVGAFSDKENATRLVASLKKAGHPAKVLRANTGLTKVALRSFPSRKAAEAAKEMVKKEFPAVWIYSE